MNLPIVPYRAFCSLAGAELSKETDRQLVRTGVLGMVLFADAAGQKLSVMPVGEGQFYSTFDDVAGVEIQGLRAVCAMRMEDLLRAEDKARQEQGFAEREKSLAARERRVAEAEARLGELARKLEARGVAPDAGTSPGGAAR